MITLTATDRILAIHLGGVGDVLLATPALHALRQRYPRNHVAILVAAHAEHLLDHCPDVDAQWVIASRRLGPRWFLQWTQDQEVLRRLRREQFALAIHLYWMASWIGSLRLAYYVQQIRPRQSLGYNTDGKGWWFTYAIPQSSWAANQVHETAHVAALVQHLGCPAVNLAPRVWVTEEERTAALRQLATWGVQRTTFLVILSPGARQPAKRWPAPQFAQLGQWLVERFGARILLVGEILDRPIARVMAEQLRQHAVDATGATSLRELMALIAHARLVVTNDTGTMHLAAALQRPLVALFGPTAVARFAPLGDPARQQVLQPATRCLADLSLEEVQHAVERVCVVASP